MNKILFYLDQEVHEPLFLAVYGGNWQKAVDQISGDGAETQLVNALAALGFDVFDKRPTDVADDDEG